MPMTRSASRSISQLEAIQPATKRKGATATDQSSPKKPRVSKGATTPRATKKAKVEDNVDRPFLVEDTTPLLPAVLSFSFEDAKQHLIGVDSRFKDLFSKMECKPFQRLERVHPFRSLVESILGQQISWLAARSIRHKFLRLYDPSLPEKPADYSDVKHSMFFPTPQQVAKTDIAALRSAGLSVRKAEYVQDLAVRFADGRLTTDKLVNANDEELTEMLTAVRGIGVWTVDMFAIFSLRRPDILPIGDLGVQRGMLRWFLALHSPAHPFTLSPHKVGSAFVEKKAETSALDSDDDGEADDALPEIDSQGRVKANALDAGVGADIASVPDASSLPPLMTPSIRKTLTSEEAKETRAPLPEGLTLAALKTRVDGKKIKGAFLTPKEMEDLSAPWKPYRSIGVYFMWSLAGADGK